MKIALERYGAVYTVELIGNDYTVGQMKEAFSRLLVQAGFSPESIEFADGGHYECKYMEEA